MSANYETSLREWEADNALETEFMKVAATSGQVAMKSAILINGGAAVAMLAFIGHALSSDVCIDIKILTKSMSFFTIGVFLGAIATGTTYITNILYQFSFRSYREKKVETSAKYGKISKIFFILSILLVIPTYILFLKGACTVYLLIMNNA